MSASEFVLYLFMAMVAVAVLYYAAIAAIILAIVGLVGYVVYQLVTLAISWANSRDDQGIYIALAFFIAAVGASLFTVFLTYSALKLSAAGDVNLIASLVLIAISYLISVALMRVSFTITPDKYRFPIQAFIP